MTVHIIGAGLAGLSAAVELTARGVPVTLSEAGPRAGGRCRSYFDAQLGMEIDNGNHLVLSGNTAVHAYLARIGASDRLRGPAEARFDFVDAASGERWTVRPSMGVLPWWIFDRDRRVPGTSAGDYLALASLLTAKDGALVGETIPTTGPLWDRLIEPVLLAGLNTEAAQGSARLAGRVVRETMARGGRAYLPQIAQPTLAAAFVDPALEWLAARGVTLQSGRRLRALELGKRLTGLDFGAGIEPLAEGDTVILAVPAPVAQSLIPGLSAPTEFRAIVSAHFAVPPPPGMPMMLGLTNVTVEWIFAFPDRISVTVSGADRLLDTDRAELAALLWADVARVIDVPAELPAWQLVKERRATFAATPEQDALRPAPRTAWPNLVLAGDWTRTGLPATIEGALRSGAAAALVVTAA
ncbi:hydroxysqualene dehydroxylase HpnE [Glacieibacterium sp.]|uniref:hydroxysqualene dehydroxylase HpnE n=1 Tax=Glacieibacterium sp. TaxID=2860237 RepID=UPI003B002E33